MDTIQILTNLLLDNQYVSIVTAVVTLASAVAATAPKPKEGTVWASLYSVINFLAINIGKAKDK